MDEEDFYAASKRGYYDRIDVLGNRLKRMSLLVAASEDVEDVTDALTRDLRATSLANAQKLSLDRTTQTFKRLDPTLFAPTPAPASPKPKRPDVAPSRTSSEASEPDAGPTPPAQDPRYAKFFKMLKMHVPRGAVEAKMRGEGLDPSVLDNPPGAAAAAARPPANPLLGAIQAKGGGNPLLGAIQAKGGGNPLLGAIQVKGGGGAASNESGPALKDDPKYSKYFKMLKMHVPKMAIAAKMAGEGLDAAVLDMDSNAPAPSAGASASKATSKTAELGPPIGCARTPTKALRKLFVDVVGDVAGTVWDRIDLKTPRLDVDELADLEKHFGQPEKKSKLRSQDAAAAKVAAASDMVEASKNERKELRSIVTEAAGGKRDFGSAAQRPTKHRFGFSRESSFGEPWPKPLGGLVFVALFSGVEDP